MADEPTDVTPDPSTGQEPTEPQAEPTAPVSASTAPDGKGVPLENRVAEILRRQQQQDRTNAEILAALQALQRPQAPSAPTQEYTIEQLQELAQAGHAGANAELMRRVAAQEYQQRSQAQAAQQAVIGQLQALLQRYPVLSDASHPLTQAVYQTRQALWGMGHQPGQATDLEAIKVTIADHPSLAAEVATARPAPDLRRPAPAAPVDGATVRRQPATPTPQSALSPKALAIAQRMGIKDPKGAIGRFHQRNERGQNAVSPQVAQIIREER